MATVITTPDIDFAGFYYPDILKELLFYLRRNKERLGLTDENEYEVHVQLLRAFALIGHLNNCRLDLVAQEMLIDSLRLLESLKRLLKLIGVQLNSASPAEAAVLLKLSEVTAVGITGFIPELSEFTTDSVPPIPYEVLEEDGVDLERTDRAYLIYGAEIIKTGVGSVSTIAPDVFTRTSGDTFPTSAVGMHLLVSEGLGSNGGEYRVIEYVASDQVRVVRVPYSGSPAFQDETGLTWQLVQFTDDFSVENYTPGQTYTPWTTPVAGDCLYIGHPQCMPGQLTIDVFTPASGITGCWEYHDDQMSKLPPTAVVDNHDGTLRFNVNSLLGTPDRRGAEVTVEYVPTGAKERVTSTWHCGVNSVLTTGLLGQTTASEDVDDYLVTATWVPFENQDDGSTGLTQDGSLTYNFPQDEERDWSETEVNLELGWWLRFRIVSVSTPSSPVIEEIGIADGDQYMMVTVAQGESVGPQIVGSSDGTADQSFALPETPFLDASELIEVDETGAGGWVAWTRVESFINSGANSRHYMIDVDAKDKATVYTGNGINGKIPVTGSNNVRASYRIGGDVDGNVGAGEISNNVDGVSGIAEVSNPRSAYGWRMKDGGTDADIERVKRDAPASLRTRGTATTSLDVEILAVRSFQDRYGSRPVARAFAVEEGCGPKTIKLLVVGNGGVTLTAEQKEDLETYFNGDKYASPPVKGVLLSNHKVYVFNYEPRTITIAATVVWPGGNAESVRNALLTLLTPLAMQQDGVTFAWSFNGWIARSRIFSAIHDVDPTVSNVTALTINSGSTSLRLGKNQLPVTAASNITINIQATEP